MREMDIIWRLGGIIIIDLTRASEENKEKIEMLVLKGVMLENVKCRYPAWIVR